MLAITSLVSIVLMSLHLSDDMVRGFSQPGLDNFIAIVVLVVWLYGTLMVRERLAGLITMLLGAVCAIAMPILHLRGASIVEVVRSSGGLFFYWTVFTLGVTGGFSLILAAHGLWSLRRGKRVTERETKILLCGCLVLQRKRRAKRRPSSQHRRRQMFVGRRRCR